MTFSASKIGCRATKRFMDLSASPGPCHVLVARAQLLGAGSFAGSRLRREHLGAEGGGEAGGQRGGERFPGGEGVEEALQDGGGVFLGRGLAQKGADGGLVVGEEERAVLEG